MIDDMTTPCGYIFVGKDSYINVAGLKHQSFI